MCISYAISGSCYLLNGEGSYLVEVYTTRIFDFLAGWVWGERLSVLRWEES